MPALFHLGADNVYRCDSFQQFIWQSHGFGTRHGNPPAAITLRQIHSDLILNAEGLSDRQFEGDALISAKPGLSVGVRTADCVPILLLDEKCRAVAAVHAGWRGTVAEIVRCVVRKLHSDFGSEPANLMAAIGPSIRECCYEVGPEVASRFTTFFPEWQSAPDTGGKRHLNLPEANRRQLLFAGVPENQIFDSGLCTACQLDVFFSFRREPQNPGRMLSSIGRIA